MRNIPNNNRLALAMSLLAGVATGYFPGASAAGDDGDDKLAFMLEEIIVTATRREQTLQDIPMSINAFSGDKLNQSGVVDLRDVQFLAPGVHINNQFGITNVTIRGIGNNSITPGAESGAAVHVDGVYLAQPTELGTAFFDVQRIEVLHGPQGTLYGRNATGGAINIITKAPTEEFEAGGSVSLRNYDLIETEGYVSGSLVGDTLLARVAFKTRDSDGFTPNLFNGESLDNDDSTAVRGKLHYEPAESFRLHLAADYARDDGVPTFVYSRGITGEPLTGETMGSVLPSGRTVNYNNDNSNEKESSGLSARAEWDLAGMTLASLTAYRKHSWFQAIDFDGTDQSIFFIERGHRKAEQVSQELTLTSSGEQDFDWVLGAYYFHSDQSTNSRIQLPTLGITSSGNGAQLEGDAYALFGEVNYPMLESLTLTLGSRYSYEKKSIDQSVAGIPEQLEDSWESFTPKVALIYTFNDGITAYATVGWGFKAGVYNTGTIQGNAVAPEEVKNYEVGLKTSLYDDRLRGNISVFHMDYSDLQVFLQRTNPITGLPATILDNAATATIRGIELELQAQPTEGLALNGNLSWLDAKYEKWPNAVDPLRGNASFSAAGNRLLDTPEWAGSVGATYTRAMGNWGSAALHGEYSYKGKVFFDPFESEFLSEEGYGLFNARLTFEHLDNGWRVAIWAKNLTDELAATRKFASASALTGRPLGTTYLPPRTYGITVGYNL